MTDIIASEVFLADGSVQENDGLVWKELLREGKWELSPSENGPAAKPMYIRKKGPVGDAGSHYDISLEDIKESFEAKAFDNVTVPSSHKNGPIENNGYIRRVKVLEDDDGAHLYGGIEFTEPDVLEKAKNGSLPGTSCGLLYDHVRKQDGKVFPIALEHAALTPKPWINGMKPFGLSEDEEGVTVLAFSEQVSDEVPEEPVEEDTEPKAGGNEDEAAPEVQTVANGEADEEHKPAAEEDEPAEDEEDEEKVELSELQQAQQNRLIKLAQADEAQSSIATDNHRGGDTVKKDKKDMSPEELQLSEQFESSIAEAKERETALQNQLAELKKEKHETYVDSKIEEYKKLGLSEVPGFLKEVRAIMLADDFGPAVVLNLSEDGEDKAVKLTATALVERLIDALPREENKIALSEQALADEAGDKPAASGDEGKSVADRTKDAQEFLGL